MTIATYVLLRSLLDMMAYYQLFMIYRIFFAESFKLSKSRLLLIVGIALTTCFVSMFLGPWSVCGSMLLIVLLMGKRKIWESVLILPALMMYVVLQIIPSIMVRNIVTFPPAPALLMVCGADWAGVCMDVWGCFAITILYLILRRHKVSLILRPLEVLGFGLFFLFELFLLMGIAVIRVHYEGTVKILLNASCLFFFVLALAAYLWHLITLRRVRRLNTQIKQEEAYIQCQLAYLEQYRSENQSIRILRHDLRGHLQMLQSLQESNQTRKAELYLDSLQMETDTIKGLEFTGNQAADIVLANYRIKTQEAGIPFVCEGTFPWLDCLTPMEVCSLLSNLLDNAYDASLAETEPDISVKGGMQEHFWTLLVSNRAEKECKIRDNRMVSTKGGNHGMGLGIVGQIVEKYEGICSFSWEDGYFFCRILIPRN